MRQLLATTLCTLLCADFAAASERLLWAQDSRVTPEVSTGLFNADLVVGGRFQLSDDGPILERTMIGVQEILRVDISRVYATKDSSDCDDLTEIKLKTYAGYLSDSLSGRSRFAKLVRQAEVGDNYDSVDGQSMRPFPLTVVAVDTIIPLGSNPDQVGQSYYELPTPLVPTPLKDQPEIGSNYTVFSHRDPILLRVHLKIEADTGYLISLKGPTKQLGHYELNGRYAVAAAVEDHLDADLMHSIPIFAPDLALCH